jgi:hypothetical protein
MIFIQSESRSNPNHLALVALKGSEHRGLTHGAVSGARVRIVGKGVEDALKLVKNYT